MFITDIAAGFVSMPIGARGPNFATVSACATSANAIGEAAEMIRRGDAMAMIAGGSRVRHHAAWASASFAIMHALSRRNDDPQRASRPFDAERDGFVMGEGAGVLLLEDEEHARERGARIYAELAGYAATADAHHITEPAPDGAGLVARHHARAGEGRHRARRGGLHQRARHRDALQRPQRDGGDQDGLRRARQKLAVSSTKSMIGHTLGAAGGIEAAVTALSALSRRHARRRSTSTHPDPGCDLDYVPNTAREAKVNVALSNSMGFGGHNAVLAMRKYNE